MFTGIIEEVGQVSSLSRTASGARLEVECFRVLQDAAVGDSLATSGVCLTITHLLGTPAQAFRADLSSETVEVSTLGRLRAGSKVNLERPMRLADRLGGHLVQGHADGIGRVLSLGEEGEGYRLDIEASAPLLKYIAKKGSIAVDGVSLTVAGAAMEKFWCVIIPHTANVTTLGKLQAGHEVNLEVDILAKYVERLVQFRSKSEGGGVTKDQLAEQGYMRPQP